MEHLVTIGRFSTMTRLSVKALRIYDEAGLLRPARVDESSGYRYYARGQANRAEAIRILRSVEMPLDETGEALAHDDPALVRKTLDRHRARLADRLAQQERMLAFLEQLIAREEGVMPYDVTLKNTSPQLVAAVRRTADLAHVGEAIASGFGAIMAHLGPLDVTPSGAPMAIYHDVIDTDASGTIELCLPIDTRVDGDSEVYIAELPGGTVASTVHRGPYDEMRPAYHTLEGWISEHGRQIVGPPREIYLSDPGEVPPADLQTRIDWPIR